MHGGYALPTLLFLFSFANFYLPDHAMGMQAAPASCQGEGGPPGAAGQGGSPV